MKNLDWEDLRHFNVLAQTLKLSLAASELNTSQVTVMRRIKALERKLGATLFLRRSDGHRLTPAGTELLAATREASDLINDGANRVVARDTRIEGRVRIATTELAANWILLPRIPSFHRENPGVRLEIDASPAPLDLTNDTETLAVRFRRPETGPYRIKKLGEIEFAVYRRREMGPPRKSVASSANYIGWAGHFEDISLSRWLRRIYNNGSPALALTTFEGHLKAAHGGLGAAGLPVFIGSRQPLLERVDSSHAFRLDAWLVVPNQIAATTRIRKASQFVTGAFHQIRK